MAEQPVITLLTDYGLADGFVGVLHGVIARIAPHARVIDITHGIPRHDVHAGAVVLARSLLYMPVGVHVAVVDPGVGSERRAVALRLADGRVLVGPDNGLLWMAARISGGIAHAVEISSSPWRLEPVSATFHGRDLFAPVAASLAVGQELEAAGQAIDSSSLTTLEMPEATVRDGVVVATVVSIDEFGNAQLAAGVEMLSRLGVQFGYPVLVSAVGAEPTPASFVRTFADVEPGQLILHEDSAGWLAVAVNRGSASERLGLRAGDEVLIARRPASSPPGDSEARRPASSPPGDSDARRPASSPAGGSELPDPSGPAA